MRKAVILFQLLLFLRVIQVVASLGLNISNTTIFGSKDQYRIELKPVDNYGVASFNYTRIPRNWLRAQKYLIVPKGTSIIYNQVLISVVIKDQSKSQYKLSLIFVYNSQHMFMDSTVYGYDVQLSLDPITTPITNQKIQLERLIVSIISQARNSTNVGKSQPLVNLFEQNLSQKEIKQAINSNNIPALIKLISKIPTDENTNCVQQLAYLSQVAAIAHDSLYDNKMKQEQIQKDFISKYKPVQQVNTSSVPDPTGTNKLNVQILARITNLRNQSTYTQQIYIDQIQQLKVSYIKFNNLSDVQQKIKDNITESKLLLQQNIRDMDGNYSKINDLNYLIPRASENDKIIYTKSIQRYKKMGDFLKGQVAKIRLLIQMQEEKLKQVMDKLDKSKLEFKNIESSVIKTQQSLSNIYGQLLNLYQPIYSYENVPILIVLQNKLILNLRNTVQIDSILQQRKNLGMLSSTILYLDSVLDNLYYQCYGIYNTKSSRNAEIFVYEINFKQFMQYIRKFTQTNRGTGLIFSNESSSVKKVTLQRSNVLSSIWTTKFGDAIELSNNQVYIDNASQTFCVAGEALDSYNGIILQVTGNVIQVQMSGTEINYVLHGACSRVEMVDKMPQKGNILFWRGRLLSKNVYDSYYSLIL